MGNLCGDLCSAITEVCSAGKREREKQSTVTDDLVHMQTNSPNSIWKKRKRKKKLENLTLCSHERLVETIIFIGTSSQKYSSSSVGTKPISLYSVHMLGLLC